MASSSHALLSASSSDRWLHCNPSARLSLDFEVSTSDYALEGTKAHYGAEKWLKTYLRNGSRKELNDFLAKNDYPSDMVDYIKQYADYVMGIASLYDDAQVNIELTVDLSDYIPNGFGTVDCAILSPSNRKLHIIDFKYGKGVPVSADNNSQMMIYALGVLTKMEAFATETVSLTIYQPRIRNISTFDISVDDLIDWSLDVLIPKAKLAWEGKGEIKAGSWCKFCPAKPRCKEYSKYVLSLPKEIPVEFRNILNTLTDDELSDVLDKAKEVSSYISAIEEELKKSIIENGATKGYTIQKVRGKRVLNDGCINLLESMGIDVYETKAKSITKLEKENGKTLINEAIDGIVSYASPSYRLVKLSEVFKNEK